MSDRRLPSRTWSTARATLSSSAVVTPGRIASRTRACISATTRPARRILAISSAERRTRPSLVEPVELVVSPPAGVDGPDEPDPDVVGRTHAVDRHQLVPGHVPGDEGLGLLLVQRQPP